MNIVLAQLKKDIQCQRAPLILWGICVGLGLVPFALLRTSSHFNFADLSRGEVMVALLSLGGIAVGGLITAGLGLLFLVPILVIRIVHEDTLPGTTAFWMTRPIPRGKLLAAKALLIAVLPLPSALLGDVHFGTGNFWMEEFAWIAAFAAISSITSGAKDFILYGVAFLCGKSVVAGILGHLWIYFHGSDMALISGVIPKLSVLGRTLHLTRADLYHFCYFAGLSVVFVHQCLTLKTRHSIAILIGVIVAVSLLQMGFGFAPARAPVDP